MTAPITRTEVEQYSFPCECCEDEEPVPCDACPSEAQGRPYLLTVGERSYEISEYLEPCMWEGTLTDQYPRLQTPGSGWVPTRSPSCDTFLGPCECHWNVEVIFVPSPGDCSGLITVAMYVKQSGATFTGTYDLWVISDDPGEACRIDPPSSVTVSEIGN